MKKPSNFDEERTIVQFLSKAHIQHHEVFSHLDFEPKKTKMARLFDLIKEDKYTSLDQLKSALYNKEANADTNFRKLFHGFKEKLYNTLFLVDTNNSLFNERTKAYYVCAKRALASRMLNERGAPQLAAELAELTIPICLKYEFTDLSVMLIRYLIKRITLEGNVKKYLKYSAEFKKLNQLYSKEIEMDSYIGAFVIKSNVKSISERNKLKEKLINYEEVLIKAKNNLNEKSTIELIRSSSNFLLEHYYVKSQFQEFKYYSQITLQLLNKKSFVSAVMTESILVNSIKVAFITKDTKECLSIDNQYLTIIGNRNTNWYVIKIYLFLALLHQKEYVEVSERLNDIYSQKTFKSQPPIITEQFIIIQAYIYFIENLNAKTPSKSGEFRISKFLNQVPEYSKDKEGTNISILLIQILYFLKEDKYSKIIDRIEALKLYSFRHLRKDENFRSQCFFRMLNEMVKADFRRKGTAFRTEKLYKKLVSVPIETFPNAAEREIIPYEDLWELILNHLK